MADLRSESGSGPVSMVVGVAIFLGFLLLATQTLLHLYATSVATSAAFDGARRAAAEDGGGCAAARVRTRELLGTYGRRSDVEVACAQDDDRLLVTVRGPTPADLLAGFDAAIGRAGIERTATVRIEHTR